MSVLKMGFPRIAASSIIADMIDGLRLQRSGLGQHYAAVFRVQEGRYRRI
jgi:hypothetical protein